MIELYSRTIELQTARGRKLLCDPERLQEELRDAFRAAGIKESWPAEQVLAALKEEAVVDEALAEGAAEGNLDQLVIRLLVHAGYPEVATEFARQHQLLDIENRSSDERSEWDEERLTQLLSRHFVTSGVLYKELSRLVFCKLQALGFRLITDALIIQVAEHTLNSLAQAYRSVPTDASGWLMPPGFWEAFFSGAPARLMASGALKIHPVSELFPVLRLSLDGPAVVDLMREAYLSPEATFAEVWDCCLGVLAETVAVLVKETGKIMTANRHHPIVVSLAMMPAAIDRISGKMSGKARQTLAGKSAEHLGQALKQRQIHAIVSLT